MALFGSLSRRRLGKRNEKGYGDKNGQILKGVPTIVIAQTFCASRDTCTQVSYGWCLLIQLYFCAV